MSKRKTLYFDVTRLLEWEGRYTGMERVAYELAYHLIHSQSEYDAHLVYFAPKIGFMDITQHVSWNSDNTMTSALARTGSIKEAYRSRDYSLAARRYMERKARRAQYARLTQLDLEKDGYFFTSDGLWDRDDYIEAIVQIGSSKLQLLHLVHDIVPLVMPHVCHDYVTHAMKKYFATVVPYVDTLISISKNTQNDFLNYFQNVCKPTMKKIIIRHGDDFNEKVIPKRPAVIGKDFDDFILCLGTVEIRKNHMLLYEAYRLAYEQNISLPKLLIVGRQGWLADQTVKLMRDDPVVQDKIMLAGPLSDEELAWCYENCKFTTLASIYEGWGLQVAESLYYGKVVAASNAGPIPEVGGNLNVYFSPYSSNECLDALVTLTDEAKRTALENEVRTSYKPTLWIDTMRTIITGLN